MSLAECPFCWSHMECQSSGMHLDTWVCPTCGAQRSHGWEKLPDPDRLRRRADRLEELADDVENSELATRFEEGT